MKVLILALILGLVSCKSKEKTEPEFLEIRGVGSVDFGKVTLGETRTSGVLVNNQTSSSVRITYSSINYPFSLNSYSTTCGQNVAPKQSCYLSINFSPTVRSNYSLNLNVNGTIIPFKGYGSSSGEITLEDNFWDVGAVVVGTLHSKRVTLTNTGDQRIIRPTIKNSSLFSQIGTNCLSYVLPSASCHIDVLYQNTVKGNYLGDLILDSDGIEARVSVQAFLSPATAEGVISFTGVPIYLKTNGSDEAIISLNPVRDLFQNSVNGGLNCELSGINIDFPNGTSFTLDSDAKASFLIRTTVIKSGITVAVNCQQAYGTFTIKASAEEANGSILVEPFGSVVRADGVSGTTIKTQLIRDEFGSVINDGDLIYFTVTSGDAILDRASAQSFNGRVQVRVISPENAGVSTIKITASPKYNEFGAITSWGAESSELTVSFIAGFPQGEFPITTNVPTIYYKKDDTKNYTDESTVTIGPITDNNGNPVGENRSVNVRINGGKNKVTDNSEFNLLTATNSEATFILVGAGVASGWISIEVDVGSVSKTLNYYLSEERNSGYSPFVENLELFKSYKPTQMSGLDDPEFNPLSNWRKINYSLVSLEYADTNFWGLKSFIGEPKMISNDLKFITDYNCFQSIGLMTHILPCPIIARVSGFNYWGWSGLYVIGYSEDLGVLRSNNLPSPMNSEDALGRDAHLLSGITYNQRSDSYVYTNGFQFDYLNLSSPLYSYPSLFYINHPSGILNQFALLSFTKKNSNVGPRGMMGIYSPVSGDTYLYGGINSSNAPTNSLYRLEYEEDELSYKSLSFNDSESYGPPPELIKPTVYFENDTIYVIGGITKVAGVWELSDAIWKVNTSLEEPIWDRVCSVCNLPQSDSILQYIVFPLVNVVGDLNILLDHYHTSRIYKDMKNRLTMHVPKNGLYEINLVTGETSVLNDDPNLLSFTNASFMHLNENSGRYTMANLTSKEISDNSLYSYESPAFTKPYYIIKHNLGEEAFFGAQRFQFDVGVLASVKNTSEEEIFGAEVYVFNFIQDKWDVLGVSSSILEGETVLSPVLVTKVLASGSRNYINNEGEVYLMVFPTHNTTENSEVVLKINHSIIRGVW